MKQRKPDVDLLNVETDEDKNNFYMQAKKKETAKADLNGNENAEFLDLSSQ